MAKLRIDGHQVDFDLIMTEKRDGETAYQTARRLIRARKIDEVVPDKPDGSLVSKGVARKYLKKHGMRISADVKAELERAVIVILDAAMRNARRNQRQTVKACDVRGDSVSLG